MGNKNFAELESKIQMCVGSPHTLLAQDLYFARSRHFLFTLKARCAIMSIEFF